jgi:hypothetical protein
LYAYRNAGPGGLSNLAYSLFFLLVLCQLRAVVRARYAIPVRLGYKKGGVWRNEWRLWILIFLQPFPSLLDLPPFSQTAM